MPFLPFSLERWGNDWNEMKTQNKFWHFVEILESRLIFSILFYSTFSAVFSMRHYRPNTICIWSCADKCKLLLTEEKNTISPQGKIQAVNKKTIKHLAQWHFKATEKESPSQAKRILHGSSDQQEGNYVSILPLVLSWFLIFLVSFSPVSRFEVFPGF